jgi:CLIP-associating protein 1/2
MLESTNSLISLLAEICDPVYLLGLLRASLGRYISAQQGESNGDGVTHQSSKVQASGYIFGFNGMGMCILRLPAPVIEVEAPKLASVVTDVSSLSRVIGEADK